MEVIKNVKLFLLDMDGTLYIDDKLIDGALEFLEQIKKRGSRYMFLTNNSSKSVDKYVEKLAKLGISSETDDFFTSTDATVLYLRRKAYKKVYAFGTASFKQQLRGAGIPVTDTVEEGIDCLCIGFDTELSFQKLEDACVLLNKNVDFVATNPDLVCPTSYGCVPDCGSVCGMLYTATQKRPVVIGKPNPDMVLSAMKKAGFEAHETALVGDRLYTDIACAVNAGIHGIFVLSGEGTMEDVAKSDVKPELIYDSVKQIYKELIG